MNLNQITIPVTDVPRAIDFYSTLGLHLIVHTHDNYARFECPVGDSTFSVHRVEAVVPDSGTTVYFEVDDLNQEVSRLSQLGIQFEQLPVDQSWLWTEARLKDPDGNQIILYHAGENRKNPPWRIISE